MIYSRNKQQGFTAVELLVTLFVAAAFLIAGYQLFNVVITDGGETRAESRASNVAYDYLRRYSASATNPCTPSSPLASQAITIPDLANVQASVAITCPQDDAPSLSKVEAIITYGSPATSVRYATYVDKSKGASPVVDVTDGLIAQYPLNGSGKAKVGGPDARVFGAIPTTDRNGKENGAYSFNAAVEYQYLEIPSNFGLSWANATLSIWVYQASTSASGQYVKVGSIGGPGFGIGVGGGSFVNTDPGSKIVGIFEGVRWIDTGTALGTGWHHLAFTVSSTGVPSIYRDGVLVGTYTGPNMYPPDNLTRIGGYVGRYVTGSIDDFRVYNRALSASEITQLYTLGPQ